MVWGSPQLREVSVNPSNWWVCCSSLRSFSGLCQVLHKSIWFLLWLALSFQWCKKPKHWQSLCFVTGVLVLILIRSESGLVPRGDEGWWTGGGDSGQKGSRGWEMCSSFIKVRPLCPSAIFTSLLLTFFSTACSSGFLLPGWEAWFLGSETRSLCAPSGAFLIVLEQGQGRWCPAEQVMALPPSQPPSEFDLWVLFGEPGWLGPASLCSAFLC